MFNNVGTVTIEDDNYVDGKREAVVMRIIETRGADSLVLIDNGTRQTVPTDAIKRYAKGEDK